MKHKFLSKFRIKGSQNQDYSSVMKTLLP